MSKTKPQRRKFLGTAAAGAVGAGTMAFPMVSTAQTTSLRFQSTWPAKDIFHEYANDFAKKVNDMAGGRLKIEVLPAGAVVPAFQLLEAVTKGTLDGGHGVVAYHYGKNSALALWGSGPGFGMDPNMVLAWHNYGGGKALLRGDLQVASTSTWCPTCTARCRPSPRLVQEADRQGRGHEGPEVPHRRPGGGHVHRDGRGGEPAARRRDRAGARPRPDRRAPSSTTPAPTACSASPTWPRTACCRASTRAASSSRSCSTSAKYNALPAELKTIIDYAVQAVQRRHELEGRSSATRKDYVELKKAGVKFYKTPDAILRAQLAAWDKIIAEEGGREPDVQEGARLAEGLRRSAPAPGRTTTWSTSRWPTTTTSARR